MSNKKIIVLCNYFDDLWDKWDNGELDEWDFIKKTSMIISKIRKEAEEE